MSQLNENKTINPQPFHTTSYIDVIECTLKEYPPLTFDEERRLFQELREHGDILAREKLIKSNMRLAVAYAWKRINKGKEQEIDDLISYCLEALVKAVDNFDYQKSSHFSTYAYAVFKQKVDFYRGEENIINTPDHVNVRYRELTRFINSYNTAYGKDPDKEAIMKELGLTDLQYEELINVKNNQRTITSLNKPLTADDDSEELINFISSNAVTEFDEVLNKDFYKELNTYISTLSTKKQFILKKRYGLNGHESMTVLEIARVLGCSYRAVQELEQKALQNLRIQIKKNDTYYKELILELKD